MRVVLIGGFGAPPPLLQPLRRALTAEGHDVGVAPLGFNVDCGEVTVGRVERWLEQRGPAVVVGHSRGGQIGRVLAVRRPDLVEGLVTVVTPWSVGPPVRAGVVATTAVVRAVRRAGVPLLPSIDCGDGPCCARFRVDLARIPTVPWRALWSSRDRMARADGRPPAGVDARDIETSHVGAVTSRRGQQAIAQALAMAS